MLSIVTPVINCNPIVERMTVDQINSVYVGTLGDWELIVVVHGYKPFPFTIDYPRVKILYYENEMSVARAYNKGFEQAKGDLYCCMHNDVLVPFGWNYIMARVASRGEIAFPLLNENTGYCEERKIIKTAKNHTTSACFVFKKAIWDDLGGYDEEFEVMHGEDLDFFKRAIGRGVKLTRCDVEVVHYRGASRSLIKDKGNEAFVRNWNRYYYKHLGAKSVGALFPTISETAEEMLLQK